jgi:hypothetical protein
MLRLTEVLLFLSPLGLAALWWFAGRRLAVLAYPTLAVAIVLAVGLVVYGVRRSMPRGATYVPARLEGGRIVDGHAAQ